MRPILTLALLAACSSPPLRERHQAISGATTTFMHVGFAAGPAVFTDASGRLVEERRFEPFGVAIDAFRDGAVQPIDYLRDPINALNKFTDPDTQWSYHGVRWLAPDTAQWHSPDPPATAPAPKFMAEPWALHPYQYVNQNPVTFWDPDGREPQGPWEVSVLEDAPVPAAPTAPSDKPTVEHEPVPVVDIGVLAVSTATLTNSLNETVETVSSAERGLQVLHAATGLYHGGAFVKAIHDHDVNAQREHAGGFTLAGISMGLPMTTPLIELGHVTLGDRLDYAVGAFAIASSGMGETLQLWNSRAAAIDAVDALERAQRIIDDFNHAYPAPAACLQASPDEAREP